MTGRLLFLAGATGVASLAAAQTGGAPDQTPASAKIAPNPFAQAIAVRSVADFARRQRDPSQ